MTLAEEDKFYHHKFLTDVTESDLEYIRVKDRSYGASWKKRGGVGAFMMLARKWDRLETMLQRDGIKYDIFQCIQAEQNMQGADGTALAEIRDLRRYLILVEAEMMSRRVVRVPGAKPEGRMGRIGRDAPLEDSNKHALQQENDE